MVNAASCDLPMEPTPFPLAESGPDSANEKGGFQLAGSSDMVNAASCDLPMETPPISLVEPGHDSANGKGGVSIGRPEEAAFTMSDEAAN